MGSSGQQQHGAQGCKLLELADRDERDEAAREEGVAESSAEEEPPAEEAIASVITQVAARDEQKAPPAATVQYAQPAGGGGGSGDDDEVRGGTWKSKFRCVEPASYTTELRMRWWKPPGRIPTSPPRRGAEEQSRHRCAIPCVSTHAWPPCCCCRRSIFCCLAPPTSEQYVRQDEGPVVLRPVTPLPPSWSEPVLGPQLAQDLGKKCLVLDLGGCVVWCSTWVGVDVV